MNKERDDEMDTAKIQTLKNHTTGDAVAPRTVMEAVTGLTEALADKADSAALDRKVDAGTYEAGLAAKQDTLTGTQGQVVGFDNAGKAVAAEVGGVNLYTGTKDFSGSGWPAIGSASNWTKEPEKYKGFTVISKATRYGGVYQNVDVKVGEKFTFSFYGRADAEQIVSITVMTVDGDYADITPKKGVTLSTEWARYSGTFSVINDGLLKAKVEKYVDSQTRIYICGLKLERGSVATDWSPSPEDLAYKWQIEGILPHRYVIRWDKAQAQCVRMYDAAGITTDTTHFAYRGSVDVQYNNPFDSIYPWSHRKLCKVDKAKYKQIYADGGDILGAITKWEGEPGFDIGPDVDGMDMVYTPEFWMRQWEDGVYVYYGIADGPIDGWIYVRPMVQGRYLASQDGETGLRSMAGDVPYADTVQVQQLHSKAKSDNMTLDTIQSWCAETMLMWVEYACLDVQKAIGRSVGQLYQAGEKHPTEAATKSKTVKVKTTDAAIIIQGAIFSVGDANDLGLVARAVVVSKSDDSAGVTTVTLDREISITTMQFWNIHGLYNAPDKDIGSKSGYIGVDGKCLAYYRGRNCYGNANHYLLGAYRQQNTGHIWVAPDEDVADELDGLNTQKCVDTGCALPQVQGEGWIEELHLLPAYPAAPFCKSIGGSSTAPVGDYCWWPALANGDTICLAGSYAYNNWGVGRCAADWRRGASGASWNRAASLALKPPKGGV